MQQTKELEGLDAALALAVLQEESYSLREVADAIGKDISTVREYLRQGVFPHAYKDGPKSTSAWRVPQRDMDAYDAMRLATMQAHAQGAD